jgi:hypothetical protein
VTSYGGWWVLMRWWVVAGFLQTFLHPRVRKGVFEQNPPQPTTTAKPTTLGRRGNSFSPRRRLFRDLTGEAAQRLEMSLCARSM